MPTPDEFKKTKIIPSSYGSIAHLPNSRMGIGDKPLHAGQVNILWTKPRDKHDRIIVQEKVDGSCVSVLKKDGILYALGRAGFLCNSSPYKQHLFFDAWVKENISRFSFLEENQRLVGEWMAMAHGIKYNMLHEPFVVFDLITGKVRHPYDEFKVKTKNFIQASLLHDGGSLSLESLLPKIVRSYHGGEFSEGAVYRVERKGVVDFLGKWVNAFHICGKYFSEEKEVWNDFPNKEHILNEALINANP